MGKFVLDPEEEDNVLQYLVSLPARAVVVEKRKERTNRPTPTIPMLGSVERKPPNWVGNYGKTHDPNDDLCGCSRCIIREYSYLHEGTPVQVHPAYPVNSPQMRNIVGLYDKRITSKIQVECYKCRRYIELEGAVADAYTSERQSICHFGCVPDEERKHLESVGYSLPYVIFAKKIDVGTSEPIPELSNGTSNS